MWGDRRRLVPLAFKGYYQRDCECGTRRVHRVFGRKQRVYVNFVLPTPLSFTDAVLACTACGHETLIEGKEGEHIIRYAVPRETMKERIELEAIEARSSDAMIRLDVPPAPSPRPAPAPRHPDVIDPVTGVPRFLDAVAGRDIVPRGTVCFVVSLRGMSQVNAIHGMHIGDRVLRIAAVRLRSAVPDADVLRVGGDEFVVAWTSTDGQDPADIARRLVQAVAEPPLHDLRATVGGAIGIAGAPWKPLVALATEAEMRARAQGVAFVIQSSRRDATPA